MRLNHVLCPESLSTLITPESLLTPIKQCQSLCVIKSIIFGLHPMIILQNKFICFQTKSFLDVTPQLSFIFKTMCLVVGSEFSGSHRRLASLHTLSRVFTVGHIFITKNNGAFTQGGVYPYLLILDTYFHFHVYNL